MSSAYRFSGPVVVRLMGVALVGVGVLVVVWVALAGLAGLPGRVLAGGLAVAALLLVGLLGLAAAVRRRPVVDLDDVGYRIRFVRGAGVRQARWREVEDVAAVTVAGERCVVLRLRDGRTSTVPVGVLAGRTEDFVQDLRAHLDRGHGYRPLRRRP
jgi:hypothetical protein